mgnify:CR=1 FL=1
MANTGYIDTELYQQIHKAIPVVCVDFVLKKDSSFLLAKRINKPAQGQWFLPGGRIMKNETFENAVLRKMKEEVGIEGAIVKILGVDETFFPDGPFDDSTHTINIVFLVSPKSPESPITLDSQNEEYQWYTHIDDTWHPYVKKSLALAGFTKAD